jgi:hypothetical protein
VVQFIDDFDPQNWWNSSTYRLSPNIAGYYLINYGVWFDNFGATNGQTNAQVTLNGTTNSLAIDQSPINNVSGQGLKISKLAYLNGTTDYIQFIAYQSSGSNQNLLAGNSNGSGTWFSASLISVGVGSQGSQGPGSTPGLMNYAQVLASQVTLGASGNAQTIASVSLTTNGYPVQLLATGDANNLTANTWCQLRWYRGASALGGIVQAEGSGANENSPYGVSFIDTVAAGSYTWDLKAVQIAGGSFQFGESSGPVLTAVELAGAIGFQGFQGFQGRRGAQGPQGFQGPQGWQGFQVCKN